MVLVIKIPKKPWKFGYFHGFGDQNTKKNLGNFDIFMVFVTKITKNLGNFDIFMVLVIKITKNLKNFDIFMVLVIKIVFRVQGLGFRV